MRKNNTNRAETNKRGLHGGNESTYTLTIDTLALTMMPTEEGRVFNYKAIVSDYSYESDGKYLIGEDYFLMNRVQNDKSHNYSFNLYWQGENIGMLHTDPRRGRRDFVKLNFLCSIFYQEGKTWYEHYVDVARLLRLKVSNIMEVHVAYDSYAGCYQWLKERYSLSHWMLGKDHKDIRYVPLTNVLYSHTGTTMVIGKMSAGKRVACYSKSAELVRSEKWYIKDYHKCNGLDVGRMIDRVEVRLTNTWLKNYGFTVEALNTQEGLESLFITGVKEIGFNDMTSLKRDRDTDYKPKYEKQHLFNPDLFDGRTMKRAKRHKTSDMGKKSKSTVSKTFKSLVFTYITTGKSQDLHYLRYFVRSEINWTVYDKANTHNGLVSVETLNLDYFRMLAKRYVSAYRNEGKHMGEAVEERLKSLEDQLFEPLSEPLIVSKGANQVKILSAHAAMYSRFLFAPPQS